MKHQVVDSSCVHSVAHDEQESIMHVTYKSGKTYAFNGVSPDQFQGLLGSKSIGKHLNGMGIKGTLLEK